MEFEIRLFNWVLVIQHYGFGLRLMDWFKFRIGFGFSYHHLEFLSGLDFD